MSKKTQPKQGFWSRFLQALSITATVAPSVVQIVRPEDAKLASDLGTLTNKTIDAAKGPNQ